MRFNLQTAALGLAVAGLTLITPAAVLAQDASPSSKSPRPSIKREIRGEAACKAFKTRVENHLKRTKENRERYLTVYTNLVNRLNDLAAKFKARGADTAKLEADISQLKNINTQTQTDYDKLVAGFEKAVAYNCGDSNNALKEIVKQIRADLKVVKEDVKKTRAFFVNTIKPDLKDLRGKGPSTSPIVSPAQ